MEGRARIEALSVTLRTKGWLEVMKPEAEKRIAKLVDQLLGAPRSPDTEGLSDEGLKQQVLALRWILGWENICEEAQKRLAQMDEIEARTEPPSTGGSPY
jgi:hypothetical protein